METEHARTHAHTREGRGKVETFLHSSVSLDNRMAWTRLAVVFAVTILAIGSKAVSGSYVDEDRGHLILEKLVSSDFAKHM